MTMHEKNAGIFKEIEQGFEKVGGVFKELLEGYENVGGIWKQFFAAITFRLGFTESNSGGGTQTSTLVYQSTGDVFDGGIEDKGNWITPKDEAGNADYEMRYTLISGTLDSATMNEGVWHDMNTGWSATISSTGPGNRTTTYQVDLRINVGPVIASGNSQLEVTEI